MPGVTSCSMHWLLTIFNGAGIKVEVANFPAVMDTLEDQDAVSCAIFYALKFMILIIFLSNSNSEFLSDLALLKLSSALVSFFFK